jgi:glycosyltransferase involved in cell wall biosynthesis
VRIAQVAPLFENVPPARYGGTERVVSYLTEELVRQGHRVTLFATAESRTSAELVPIIDQPLRGDPHWMAHALIQLERVLERSGDFDVLHFHTDQLHYPLLQFLDVPAVTTLHGRLDIPGLQPLHRVFWNARLVSISGAQRAPLPDARWVATVPHGLPPGLYRLGTGAGGYLTFIGRISPEKRLDRAIEIARRVGLPLHVGAKVDPADRKYFKRVIEPLLSTPGVVLLGEVDDRQKIDLLADAVALLFPIDWPEPFGLVMVEAMASGTPVIAFRGGSVEEILQDGVTGAIVDTVDQAVSALPAVLALDRGRCREEFERRFSVRRMARDYVRVYEQLMDAPQHVAPSGLSAGAVSHG